MAFERRLGPRLWGRGHGAGATVAATLPPHQTLCRAPPARRARSAAKPVRPVPVRHSRPSPPACGTLPHGQGRVPPARPTARVPANSIHRPSGTNHATPAPSEGSDAPARGDREADDPRAFEIGRFVCRVVSPLRACDYDADQELNDTDDRSLGPQWHRQKGPETRKPRSH